MIIYNALISEILHNGEVGKIFLLNLNQITDRRYAEIFKKIRQIAAYKDTLYRDDLVTELQKNPINKDIARSDLIAIIDNSLDGAYFLSDNWRDYIREEYQSGVLEKLKHSLMDKELTLDTKIGKLKKAYELISMNESQEIKSIEEYKKEYIENYENKDETVAKFIKITDHSLTQVFGDYIYSAPYCISGWPGGFKTSLAVQLANHLNSLGLNGDWYTFEDSAEVLMVKVLASKHEIPKNEIIHKNMPQSRLEEMRDASPGSLSLFEDQMRSRELENSLEIRCIKGEVQFIVIDYIQMLEEDKDLDERKTIAYFTKMAVRICKKYKIPVIYLSQLNADGKPQWSSTIWHQVRWYAKIDRITNRDGEVVGDKNKRIVKIIKNTWGEEFNLIVPWNGGTGNIIKYGIEKA